MQTRNRNPFTTIHTEGAILPSDLLQRVLENDKSLSGLSPEGYHLSGEKLTEATTRSWNRLQGSWAAFRTSRGRLGAGDAGTTLTRERWLLPLFQELGYGRLLTARAVDIEGKSYPISHGWANVPIHLVGCGVDLDKRSAGVAGASRSSPHSLMQEYLNRSEGSLWGFVSNGLRLRVLRDNASLTRQAFLEFDLEAMFEGEVYSDFVLLWLMCHQSRVEAESPAEFILEQWSKTAQEQGTRALDQLRSGVEQAIAALGSGFLRHPANGQLRADLKSGALDKHEYYRQLLRLVYRLIFLFVAEDRDLLFNPQADPAARERYSRYYSLNRLRRLAERQRGGRHADLYVGFKLVTDILGGRYALTPNPSPGGRGEDDIAVAGLGLPTLGSFLFSGEAVRALEAAELENQSFLSAIRHLTFIEEGRSRRAVDYKNLGAEELGSVYEALLELHPDLNTDAGTFALATAGGNERKTTGSYYTPSSLIQVLLDSALDPVIEQALEAGRDASTQEQALLKLKVCDPACGSGHFLIAASHRMARHLAAVRSGDDEPSPVVTRAALREVIAHCIYGVDANPMAVELCKVNLWLESLAPGKPLSFLDAHIQCGDSLVGVSPGLDISEIPDEAFNPAFGDDKATASALKKRNKRERGGDNPQGYGQLGFRINETQATYGEDLAQWLIRRAAQVDAMPEDDSTQVQAKAKAFDDYHATSEYLKNRFELDLWTAAFFWNIPKSDAESILAPTQQELIQLRNGGEMDAHLVERVKELSDRLNFFHWKLAFPQVFSSEDRGFNCVLGNPPWEAQELIEKEYFAANAPDIATIRTKAKRESLIEELSETNPVLFNNWKEVRREYSARSDFYKNSGRFPLGCSGKLNTYRLFAELAHQVIAKNGRAGQVLKTGIITAQDSQPLFGSWVLANQVVSAYDFINLKMIFPAVVANERFCLLTIKGGGGRGQKGIYAFGLIDTSQIREDSRKLVLDSSLLQVINPNDFSIPPVTSPRDLSILLHVHRTHPILRSMSGDWNPWRVRYTQGHLNSASGSDLFSELTLENLISRSGKLRSDQGFELNGKLYLPLYEGKFIGQANHRFGTFEGVEVERRFGVKAMPNNVSTEKLENPEYEIQPRYWLADDDAFRLFSQKQTNLGWLFSFRDVCRAIVDARTVQACILPRVPCLDGCPLLVFDLSPIDAAKAGLFFNSLWSSFIFDYIARQKIHGAHLTQAIAYQLPVPPPEALKTKFLDKDFAAYIQPRSLELTYVTESLSSIARDAGYLGKPFRWNESRRFLLRCELDAIYFHMYQISREDVEYIMDSFPIVMRRDEEQFGEYRTKRAILEIYDNVQKAIEFSQPFETQLSPPPSDAWIAPEAVQVSSGQSPAITVPLKDEMKEINSPVEALSVREETQLVEDDSIQPMLSDFGLYKCIQCDKMVMGYEKENHEKKVHGGRSVEWRRIK